MFTYSPEQVPTESVRLRLDLCASDGMTLGWMAIGISELRDLKGGRVVKALSEDAQKLRGVLFVLGYTVLVCSRIHVLFVAK